MLPVLRNSNSSLLSDTLKNFFTDEPFNNFFDSFFDSGWKKDNDGNTVFKVEVPGFNKDNLTVEISQGVLIIQGETDTKKVYKRYQVGNIQDVNANIKDGILSLKIIEPKEDIKKIEINE